jgi:hypothetical protein
VADSVMTGTDGRELSWRLAIDARQAGKVTDDWLVMIELALERAMGCFGAERELGFLRLALGDPDVAAARGDPAGGGVGPRLGRWGSLLGDAAGTKNPAPTEVEAGEEVL